MHGTDGDTDSFKKDIHEFYDIEDELGSGQFAVVRKIVEKETGDEFAGKYVRKKRTKASRNGMSREDIKREIEILRLVDHEKIIKVHEVYETDREMILVMELLRGGELFDYISKKDFLTEEEAIDFTRQILQGLQHLHSRDIVHLDLKPENILLKNTRRKTIKLVDFGLARVVKENEQVREIMGTPEFVAPEVLNFDTISTSTDMWALGVIAYILLSGASPFLGEDNQETFTNIIQVDYQFDEEYFNEISDEAKDFIKKLLVKDPRKRPTAHDCSRHTWVEEEVVDKKKRQRRRTTQICTFNFKRFVARKRWKMSFNKIRAMNLIAKMGIKPPPGFITEIPPMEESVVSVENNVEEKSSHKEQKKNSSTIHRKKHKQSSSKTSVEKTDSLTLKSMDIDIGEGEAVESGTEVAVSDNEDVPQAEPAPVESEPVDYGAMTLREKRRARGQLRQHDIVKSKKEIDAKTKTEDEKDTIEDDKDTIEDDKDTIEDDNDAIEDDKNPSTVTQLEDEKIKPQPETVTSTINIDHKPVAKSASGGILKKREAKAARIPSTEDNYLVTLNAALFQQKGEQNFQQPSSSHGILKHNQWQGSEDKPTEVSEPRAVDNGEVAGPGDDGTGSGFTVVEKEHEVNEEKISEPSVASTADSKGSDEVFQDAVDKDAARENVGNKTATPVSLTKKPQQKNDAAQQDQQRFSPQPWKTQRKSSNENLKANLKPLQGVSNVSLKTNRFLNNDKHSNPKSPVSNKTGGVLGKAKLFQKDDVPEKNSQNHAKADVSKTNSAGKELKAVACDINLDEPVKSEEMVPERKSKNKVSKSNGMETSKSRSGSHSKPRSGSVKDHTKNENNTRSRSNSKRGSKGAVREDNKSVGSSGGGSSTCSESITVVPKPPATVEEKAIVNGETARSGAKHSKGKDLDTGEVAPASALEIAVDKEEDDAKEELKSTSSHSLTEFKIRPRQNSGDKKAGGFDVMLTIGPPKVSPQEAARVSKFTSSSSSSLSDQGRVPNGKVLTSSSAIDVTNHTRETTQLTLPTGERHAPAQGPKYTPQRDFSKYLTNEQAAMKPRQMTARLSNGAKTAPSNRQPQPVVVKRPSQSIPPTAKGKKLAVSTVYVPRKTFGFPAKPGNQTEFVTKIVQEADDATKTTNNRNDSKRWSQSSNASDRSASSASSEESVGSSVKLENSVNIGNNGGYAISTEGQRRITENHANATLSPHASPVLERKWKATLLLPKDSEKPSLAKDRDVRIASTNVPRKNKFTNVRSMFEGK